MRIAILGSISLGALLCYSGVTRACSCVEPPAPAAALQAATAVFSGKVTKIEQDQGKPFAPKRVTFEVDRSFKAVDRKRVVVTTAADGAMCGYGFAQGKSYLVYCNGDKDALSTNLCTRTKTIEAAGEDLKSIGDGKKPQ